ncbi:hypothetical protein HYC85_015092 [Camellia sinensis]|uniref:Uncharacterized protein n=1 Tax=Camellia sinensis TaxID=4442 RepID=A0A7J7H975_CAMSI|nr:hypothetical protein HYC85_015092 [Camellia sinensis]
MSPQFVHCRCTSGKRYARKVLSPDFICSILIIKQFTSKYFPHTTSKFQK